MKTNEGRSWLCLLVFASVIGNGLTQNALPGNGFNQTLASSFQKLRDNLTERLKDRFKIPLKYYTKPLPVYFCYEPLQIISVDEISQSVTVSSTVTLTWKDPNIVWNPSHFGGLNKIEMATDLFWTPSILVPKTTQSTVIYLELPKGVSVSYDGYITAYIPAFTNTLCNLDMTNFPFDSHNCTIQFLEGDFYNLTTQMLSSRDISKFFDSKGAWTLFGYGCNPTNTHNYTPAFQYVVCHLQISRRSTFFVTNLIGPISLTSLMTLVVFWIPPEEGEKVTFLVSMFTSTFVFLNYILKMVPRSMEHIPRLNLILFATLVEVIIATVATAFVLHRYKEEQQVIHREIKAWSLMHLQDKSNLQKKNLMYLGKDTQEKKNNKSFSILRKNVVYPETVPSSEINHTAPLKQNSQGVKNPEFSREKWNVTDMFTVDGDVPSPPGFTLPQNIKNRKRRLSHEELDRIFFVLMFLLTVGVYLLAYFW